MPLKIVRVPQKKTLACHSIYFCPEHSFPHREHFIQVRNHLYLIPEHFFSARKIILLPQTFNSVHGILYYCRENFSARNIDLSARKCEAIPEKLLYRPREFIASFYFENAGVPCLGK